MTASSIGKITSVDELRRHYRAPSSLVRSKVKATLDPMSVAFIEQCPFVLLATVGSNGSVDVSPRGGPSGFLRVLESGEIVLPDLNGNNLLDALENVVRTGRAGMLLVHPGKDETLRVNGTAIVTVDDEVLDCCTADLRRPKSAIVFTPDQVFIHCAKAFRRGRVWDPASWPELADAPDAAAILFCQLDMGDPDPFRAQMAQGYADELALDLPDTTQD